MAKAEDYASWIVANEAKKGTPEFETVANAYKLARQNDPTEQLTKDIASRNPDNVNPLMDALQTWPSSAVRGMAGMAGLPQALGDLADTGLTKLTQWAGYDKNKSPILGAVDRFADKKLGIDTSDPTPISKQLGIPNIGEKTLEGWRQIPGYYEPKTTTGRIADFIGQNIALGGFTNPASGSGLLKMPITSARQLRQAAIQGTAGGLLGEAGGELLGDPGRMAGQVIGSGLPGMLMAMKSTTGKLAGDVLGNMTEQQALEVKDLMDRAAKSGSKLTVPEAIAQVTGQTEGLAIQRWAEQAPKGRQHFDPMMTARPGANENLYANTMDQIAPVPGDTSIVPGRLQQAAQGAEKSLTDFRTQAASPYYQAQRASDSNALDLIDELSGAPKKLAGLEQSRNSALQTTGQLYADTMLQRVLAKQSAAKSDSWAQGVKTNRHMDRFREGVDATLDAATIKAQRQASLDQAHADFLKTQDELAAKNLPQVKSAVNGFVGSLDRDIRLMGNTDEGKILQRFRNELAPDGETVMLPSQLESIYKSNRDKLKPGLDATPIEKTTAGVLGNYVKGLDKLIQQVSPDIQTGRQVYQQISQDVVNPAKQGIVGNLARSMPEGKPIEDVLKAQSNMLMNPAPGSIKPANIRKAAMALNKQDPESVSGFVRTNLDRIFNEQAQSNIPGESASGAAKFAANISGNKLQKDNLQALIESVGGKTAWSGFQNMLDIFGAQGKRLAPGSPTEANRLLTQDILGSQSVGDLAQAPFKMLDRWRVRSHSDAIGRLLTDPEGIDKLKQLAFTNPDSAKRTLLAGQIAAIMNDPATNEDVQQ